MATPTYTNDPFPTGFVDLTYNDGITDYVFKVKDADMPSFTGRFIQRQDSTGAYRDGVLLDSGEPEIGTVTVWKDSNSPIPEIGRVITWDFDKSGTASTYLLQTYKINASYDGGDEIELTLIRTGYQS